MRRALMVVLFFAVAGIFGGAIWMAVVMMRGGTNAADLIEAVKTQGAIVVGCGAIIAVVAVILQRTRPATEQWDWTGTASLGAGACLYVLIVRPWFPSSLLNWLPDSLAVLVPVALTVAVAYFVLRPFMKRRPAEPVVKPEPPRPETTP